MWTESACITGNRNDSKGEVDNDASTDMLLNISPPSLKVLFLYPIPKRFLNKLSHWRRRSPLTKLTGHVWFEPLLMQNYEVGWYDRIYNF
jgi:hypothetical protein